MQTDKHIKDLNRVWVVASEAIPDPIGEGRIQSAGNAPRITHGDIESNIVAEYYFTAGDGVTGVTAVNPIPYRKELDLLTFCVLVLKNGFTVTGESACASPENFNAMIGRQIARDNAVNKIWPLMGYELKTRLGTIAP